MATPIPSNPWLEPLPAASPLENVPMPWCEHCAGYHHKTAQCIGLPPPVINTVGDYIGAHDLHVVLSIEGFLELPIDAVAVEHDELAQMSYFTQQGTAIGTAAWSQPEQT